jgi:serine/threonine protein kinase
MATDPARVQAAFLAAADLTDPAARAACLDRECAGDAALRSRVEALLRAVDQPDSLLDAPIDPAAGGETKTLPPDPSATQTHGDGTTDDVADALAFLAAAGRPDSLGRLAHYEVLEVLGRGGFGIVYRAFDDVLQRVVAVKVLAPSMAVTSPARKRFVREARSAAKIQHENVVRIIEIGEQPLPYLVMEFIAGETLQQRLDRTGPLEAPDALRIGRQVAAGLAAAHATGLIHRDIKPSNILIGRADGQVKITDFGLARAADDASLTRSGAVAGTPMYMAPEQAQGETLDHRADLFSLGSVLYAMLTGRPPFRASSTLAVLKRVSEDDPRPIREVIPEVPEWLCRIVDKLHAKNPTARYQSAREVADILADCEAQLTAHGGLRDFSRIPGGRPTRRRVSRWAWAAAVALVLVLLAGVWFGHPAWLYLTNRGELELVPQDGLASVIVLQNDEGVFDDNKPHAAMTDWLDMKTTQTLKLPPGKYQLNAGIASPGPNIVHWEVTTSGPAGSNRLLVPGLGHVGWSAIVTVGRGERVSVRPVLGEEPSSPPTSPPAEFPPASPEAPKQAADVLPYLAGNWKIESLNRDAKSPPDKDTFVGTFSYDFVAGGKYLRGRSSAMPAKDGRPGTFGLLDLWSFEPGKNTIRRWLAHSTGGTSGSTSGQFIPASRTLTTSDLSGDNDIFNHQYEFINSDAFNHHYFVRDASGTIISEAHHKWTRVAGPVALPKLPLDPERPAEMKVLDQLVGNWHTEATVRNPADPDNPTIEAARVKAGPILGGRFVEVFETFERTNTTDYSLVWFDAGAKRYRSWFFSHEGFTLDFNGTWNETAKRLTWNSSDGKLEGRWTFKSADLREYEHLVTYEGMTFTRASGVLRRVDPGWVPLFNGKDLPGTVEGRADRWQVKGQVLTGTGEAGLLLRNDLRDFHFRIEAKVAVPGMAHVDFRVARSPAWISGQAVLESRDVKNRAGGLALYKAPREGEVLVASPNPPSSADGWFTIEIIAQGKKATVKVDGAITAERTIPELPDRGELILSIVDKGTVIQFRKIEIKELRPNPLEIPRTAADVLPFLVGSWNVERQTLEQRPAPDKDVEQELQRRFPSGLDRGILTYDLVAGGKVLRGRGWFPYKSSGAVFLHAFNPETKELRHWQAWSSGDAGGTTAGLFNPDNHTLTWNHPIGHGMQTTHQLDFVDSNTIRSRHFVKDASNTILRESRLTFTRTAEPLAIPSVAPDPKRPDEMKVLDRLVGEWRNEITVSVAGPDTKVETVRVKAEPILGGRFIEKVETNEATGASDYTLNWFDTDAKKYRTWFFNHAGTVTEFTGTWNEATKALTWNSADGRLEGRWTFKGDDLREYRHIVKDKDGKVLNEAAGASFRVVRDVPRKAADMLPFMAGNWKVDMQMVEPKPPPDKLKATGFQINDYVAGGKFLRSRAGTEDGSTAAFVLYSYDAGKDVLTFRGVWSNGTADDNILGRFDSNDRSVLWLKRNSNGNQFVHQLKFVDANTVTSRSYTQDESGKVISDLRITFTRTSGPITLPDVPTEPNRAVEMKVLDRLVGEWRDEATVKDAATPDKPSGGAARLKARPILGGRFIEMQTHVTAVADNYSLFWFDPAAKLYRYWFFHDSGNFFDGSGTWDEATKTLTWISSGGKLGGRWIFKTDDLREFQHLVKDRDGKLLYEAAGVSRRITPGSVPPK